MADIDLNVEDRDVVSILSHLPSQSIVTEMPVDIHNLYPSAADRQLYHEQITNALRHYAALRSRTRDGAVR